MKYPPGFPEDLQPPVDRALAEAELRFRAGAKNTPDDDDNAFQGLALEFMTTTVATFGRQACEAGRAGTSGFPHSRYRESVAWLYTRRVYSVGWSQDPPGELRPELQAPRRPICVDDDTSWRPGPPGGGIRG